MKELIEASIKNPVAGNLILAVLIVAGCLAYLGIPRETFPEFVLDEITISVVYRGATPDEIAETITTKVEEKIAGIDGIKEIRSTSSEGSAVIRVELQNNSDVPYIKDQIEREVNAILTFPVEAERPIVAEVIRKQPVISLGLYGDVSLETLKLHADRIRDELLAYPDFSQVEITGLKEREISIEVSEASLKALGLTLAQVAHTVRQNSVNLAAGTVRSRQGEVVVRTFDQKYTGDEFARIPLLRDSSGTRITLGEVATIRDSFEDKRVASTFNGKLGLVIQVDKTSTQDTIRLADQVKAYAEKKRKQLPASLNLIVWSDSSKLVRDRLDLLSRNGLQGLFLVALFLGIFLEIRLALFVALGIPVCFLGTFIFMKMFGHSLNMLSMFAFIMVLGMVVDDAMVVGEAFFQKLRSGIPPQQAAREATLQMFWPVLASVSTTCVAFLPFYGVEGTMGKFFAVTPFVIISTLIFSLFECYFILPAHLAHHTRISQSENRVIRLQRRLHSFMDWHCHVFLRGVLTRILRFRYAAICASMALLISSLGLIAGGIVKFTFFPRIDQDFLLIELEFPTGTDFQQTVAATRLIEEKILLTQEVMRQKARPGQNFPVVKNVFTAVGGQDSGKASMRIELFPSEERNVYYTEILAELRKQVGVLPDISKLVYGAQSQGPGGKPVEIQLLGQNLDELEDLSIQIREAMAQYPFLRDIADSFAVGKLEARLKLNQVGEGLGLNLSDVSNQIRSAYFGEQAVRIQRGRDDVRVYVRYPKGDRETLDSLSLIHIRLGDGSTVPLGTIASFEYTRGYTSIQHARRFKQITIVADLDERQGNAREFQEDFSAKVIPGLQERFPEVQILFRGQAEETAKSMRTLLMGFGLALMAVYAILATIFRSYLQPIVIMLAIPYGMIGAMLGHLLMGFDITMMSMFGLVALSGIVVNNSLVLLDQVNLNVRSGMSMQEAILDGSSRRFMPIFLTSCTTFLGITPMLLERSVQALFLQPMVVALSFGLIVSTFFTLLIIPAIYRVLYDLISAWLSFYHGRTIMPEELFEPLQP